MTYIIEAQWLAFRAVRISGAFNTSIRVHIACFTGTTLAVIQAFHTVIRILVAFPVIRAMVVFNAFDTQVVLQITYMPNRIIGTLVIPEACFVIHRCGRALTIPAILRRFAILIARTLSDTHIAGTRCTCRNPGTVCIFDTFHTPVDDRVTNQLITAMVFGLAFHTHAIPAAEGCVYP